MIAAPACVFLGLASLRSGKGATEQAQPRIANPGALAIEMAKALVFDDRERFTKLAATREEMEGLLEMAQPPASPEDRQGAEGQGGGDSCRAWSGLETSKK